ncbi:MAG: flavin reductase [Frankiaceae bacterium]|nr:flavin reductase [Frankiaceae bacterium]
MVDRTPLDPAAYRSVVSRYATGITVVSTVVGGRRHGLTVNSFTSLSLHPLLAMFACEHDAALHEPLLQAGTWAVSVLGADQQPAAAYFATRERPDGPDQFDGWPSRPGPVTGAPLLDGSLAWLEFRTWATYDGGDHTIVVGEVVGMELGADGEPLLYFRSSYRA